MFRRVVTATLARRGYALARRSQPQTLAQTHPDLDEEFGELYGRCAPYTMTSVERMHALYDAVRYVVAAGVAGDVVECGVWRGGSSMLAAATLARAGDAVRHVWLYDTFEGMSEPSEHDVDYTGRRMSAVWHRHRDDRDSPLLCYGALEDVRANMATVAFAPERIHYVRGKVEDTIPGEAPGKISVLRLDTDWYESTRHELVHLYPRLSPGGVLIVDDYGHWRGAREAVDGYLRELDAPVLLHRIDYTGRVALKPGASLERVLDGR